MTEIKPTVVTGYEDRKLPETTAHRAPSSLVKEKRVSEEEERPEKWDVSINVFGL